MTLSREELLKRLHEAKASSGLSYRRLAEKAGLHHADTHAAMNYQTDDGKDWARLRLATALLGGTWEKIESIEFERTD